MIVYCKGLRSSVGSNVTNIKVGDRVAMEPAATCRKCEACKEGRYQTALSLVTTASRLISLTHFHQTSVL